MPNSITWNTDFLSGQRRARLSLLKEIKYIVGDPAAIPAPGTTIEEFHEEYQDHTESRRVLLYHSCPPTARRTGKNIPPPFFNENSAGESSQACRHKVSAPRRCLPPGQLESRR